MTLDYFYGQAGELFSFFRIPKALFQEQRFQDLSTDAKTLYGILLDRMSLSVKNEWFDKKGRVFIIFTIEDVKRTLRCADNKATRLLRELEKFGLIERKRRGQGKPCLVYVKNFSSESSKESVKNRDNDDSCGSKIACQDPVKSRGIKKKENKTEMNNTNPILSDESEKMKNRELLEEYFSCSLEIDLLLRLCPDDEDTLYQIVDLLVDTCATNRKMLHIAGDDKPAEVVRSRFMKLNADHIRFVLKCLAENSSPIRNMKQYGRKEKRSPSRGYSKGRVHSCQQYAEVRAENRTTERSLIMELNFIKCGDYYIPDIKVKNPNIRLGKWGRMRKEYLRLANPVLFSDMVLNETLYEHCAEIEETAKKRMEIIVPQLAKAYGVTEQLKAENQIEWVRQMNACVAQAEEAIKGELIYC